MKNIFVLFSAIFLLVSCGGQPPKIIQPTDNQTLTLAPGLAFQILLEDNDYNGAAFDLRNPVPNELICSGGGGAAVSCFYQIPPQQNTQLGNVACCPPNNCPFPIKVTRDGEENTIIVNLTRPAGNNQNIPGVPSCPFTQ